MTTPLSSNATSALLQNTGLTINPVAQGYMGVSKTNATYTPGTTVTNTCLFLLTYGIYYGYARYTAGNISSTIYNNLISIGSTTIPALGNSMPPTYTINDPMNIWSGEATSGYAISGNTGQGQSATWYPYNTTNPNVSVTQWGYVRLHALQAQNEFNFNNDDPTNAIRYQDFASSFMSNVAFLNQVNNITNVFVNSFDYLDGVYSNMNDLITGEITGVSLSTKLFGQDCITLGKALNLNYINKFGLPSGLLQTLKKYNAITQSLSLALLASGLSSSEVESISNGSEATTDQEQKIYGSFLIIVGQDLIDILIPLNCKTTGLGSLADLLNIKKIFPNSYRSLTVPLYNSFPSSTNSKTYYLIYDGNNVSSNINTPAVKSQVGTIIIPGTPPTIDDTTNIVQDLPTGFDSYLVDILPTDIGLAAGAFRYSMLQIKNIQFVEFEKFAQVVFNIETTKNLNLLTGTTIPTDAVLSDQGVTITGLGSGPNNTFTLSDFFGCMSGLPYNWARLTSLIRQLQTTKLANIYRELYLAIRWEPATLSYTLVEVAPNNWRIATLTINNPGGGYGRGTAPAPTISLPYGATATCTIGTDPTNLNTFGKVTSVTLTNPGSIWTSAGWYARINAPPTATLPVQSNGSISTSGTNTSYTTVGWPSPMSSVVSAYIAQANTEIQSIYNTNNPAVESLNSLYEVFGAQLAREQRARYIAIPPVPVPRDARLNPYPTMILAFVDGLLNYSKNTLPHMEAQTIEAISNLNILGGQSIVGSMREIRNNFRLQLLGVPLDSEISPEFDNQKELLCNGTVNYTINGTDYTTIPSTLVQSVGALDITTESEGTLLPIGSPLPQQPSPYYLPTVPDSLTSPSSISSDISTVSQQTNPFYVPVENNALVFPPIENIEAPVYVTNNGLPLDIGEADYPSSFAGSPAINLVPINLNTTYSSGTTLPASLSIQEAIDQVVHCNCDCWI